MNDCDRCHGFGLYADPRCAIRGRPIALTSAKGRENTIACPECGASIRPVEGGGAEVRPVNVGDEIVIGRTHPRKAIRGSVVVVTETADDGSVKFAGGGATAGNFIKK